MLGGFRLAKALALKGTILVDLWNTDWEGTWILEPNAMMLGTLSWESDVLDTRVGPRDRFNVWVPVALEKDHWRDQNRKSRDYDRADI